MKDTMFKMAFWDLWMSAMSFEGFEEIPEDCDIGIRDAANGDADDADPTTHCLNC